MFEERPIIAAIHPSMISELKLRKELLEKETGRKTKGGLTCFSEMAAHELRLLRLSGEKLNKEILKIQEPPTKKIIESGIEEVYIPYRYYKKLHLYLNVLNRKKDGNKMVLEICKLKGMKKNEVNFRF